MEDLAVILRELHSLSLKLQKRELTLVNSSLHIQQTIDVLTAKKTSGGKSLKKAEQCISSGCFKDVELTEGIGKLNKHCFYESVVASLAKRLPKSKRVQKLKALDKHFWPGERDALTLYGEEEVCSLAKSLCEPTREAVDQFRYLNLQGAPQGKTLERLHTASCTFLPTSAECERIFSHK